MADVIIPCETIARLSNVLKYFPESANEWANTFRFDDNYVIATNHCYMVVERLSGPVTEPFHVRADSALIEQCAKEAQFSSKLIITPNLLLGAVVARTTMGYQYPGNLLMTSKEPNKLDGWRKVIPTEHAKVANGSLMLDMKQFMMLAETSPSKLIVFEQYFDMTRPTLVRDLIDPNWFGVFQPKDDTNLHDPATLPGWFQ